MSELAKDQDPESLDPIVVAEPSRRYGFGLTGLLLGLLALACVILPTIVLDRTAEKPAAEQDGRLGPAEEPKDGLTFRFKNFTFNVGGGKDKVDDDLAKQDLAEAEPPDDRPDNLRPAVKPIQPTELIRMFTISSIACGLLGIGFATFSFSLEQQTALAATAMSCCVAAITWQYLVAGIVIGVSFVVIVLLISILFSTAT